MTEGGAFGEAVGTEVYGFSRLDRSADWLGALQLLRGTLCTERDNADQG